MESENGVKFCAALDAFAANMAQYNAGGHTSEELWQFTDKLRQFMFTFGMDVPEELAHPE